MQTLMALFADEEVVPMLVVIEYDDGSGEALQATLEGGVVSVGHSWIPGILVQNPERCYFQADFFECAISEGGERSGDVRPDADAAFIGFRWKLVGNEADASREKMATWITRLGDEFDPEIAGACYLHKGLLRVLSDQEAAMYDRDRDCWMTYLDEPGVEAIILKSALSNGVVRSTPGAAP